MADIVHIKSGALGGRATMPDLQYDKEKGSEIGYQTEEKALYVGTENGNVRLCGASDFARIKSLETTISTLETQIADITARLEELKPSE